MATYTVRPHDSHWHVDVDGRSQGPYATVEEATAAAMEIAEATAQSGETAVVEVTDAEGHTEVLRRFESRVQRFGS